MRKIKPENIKIGDFIYVANKKQKEFRYIIKKTPNKKNKISIFEWWKLKIYKSEETHLFEIEYRGGFTGINEIELKSYMIYKLNKKEISEFNKLLILDNL